MLGAERPKAVAVVGIGVLSTGLGHYGSGELEATLV